MSTPHIDSREYKPIAHIARLESALRRIAEEPGSAGEKATIAQSALNARAAETWALDLREEPGTGSQRVPDFSAPNEDHDA